MKRYIIVFLLLLLIPMNVYAENKTPSVDKSIKVYDYADLYTDEEEQLLALRVNEFIEKSKLDLVVVTISENPYGSYDSDITEYADDFYDYNDFGFNSSKDGLLVLIDMDNRAPAISTSGLAIKYYDDERINEILESNYYNLTTEKYYDAMFGMVEVIDNYFDKGVPKSNEYLCIKDNGDPYDCTPKSVNWLITSIGSVVITIITLVITLTRYKKVHLATQADSYLTDFVMGESKDQFVSTFTNRIPKPKDTGGSGRIGGSSTHHGSSGHSHGGGVGRHF